MKIYYSRHSSTKAQMMSHVYAAGFLSGPARSSRRRCEREFADRRGVAPLEFILALPIFLALFAALLFVSSAMFVRLKAIETTRFQTWNEAIDTVPQQQLNLVQPVMDGDAQVPAELPFEWGRTWRRSESKARSETTVLGGTWDHVSLPFRETGDYQMDLKPAGLMLTYSFHPTGSTGMLTSYAIQMRLLQRIVAW